MVTMLLALVIGGVGAAALSAHSADLTRVLNSFLKVTPQNDQTDMNGRPQLTRNFNQPLSKRRIMKIEGTLQERHMRGMAFAIYLNNGAWGPIPESRKPEDPEPELKALPGGERLKITPLTDGLIVLYVPLHLSGIDAPEYEVTWARESDGPLFAKPLVSPYAPYEITVRNENYAGPLVEAFSENERKRCIELPDEINVNVRALAKTIQGNATDTKSKIEAVRKYLWANHQYSLETDVAPGDRIANFLLNKRSGHCQFFASSAVLLLRCMGVPARYVTGFYAHESADEGVSIVRQCDAHAWTEVWTEHDGWITFDPTPSGGMPGQANRVSGFEKMWDKLDDWASLVGAWLRDGWVLKIALGTAAIVALLILWLSILRRRESRSMKQKALYASASRAVQELARTFDAYLERRGAPCPVTRAWPLHLNAVEDAADWNTEREFVRDYSALRFGGDGDERVEALRARLDKMTEALALEQRAPQAKAN